MPEAERLPMIFSLSWMICSRSGSVYETGLSVPYDRKEYNKFLNRLHKISSILNHHHLECKVPDATFYLYVKVPKSFKTAEDFTLYLLYQAGIYTIPWDEADHYVRFAMTYHIKTTEEDFLNELDKRLTTLSLLK